MSENTNPTYRQVREYLIEDNGWTEEEWDQFSGYYFREFDGFAATRLTWDQWTRLAQEF